MNTDALRRAYEDFLTWARDGDFTEPADGWSADLVIAHLATNARLLRIVTDAVAAGRVVRYDNGPARRADDLAILTDAAGGRAGLIELLEKESSAYVASASALSDEAAARGARSSASMPPYTSPPTASS